VDVSRLARVVVPRPVLDVGVTDHADLLEHRQGPVDRGRIDGGEAALHASGDLLGCDVPVRPEDLLQDGVALWGDPEASLPEHGSNGAGAVHARHLTATASQVRKERRAPGVPARRPPPYEAYDSLGREVTMAKKDTLAMLKTVPLFEGLSRRELQQIMKVAKEIEFDEGHAIVEEGATGVGFHLILDGEAHVLVGRKRRATLRPGDYFGEMSLIDGGPRSATVKTAKPTRTLALTSWAFLPLLDRSPSIARKLLLEMSKRLRNLERSLTH
jgi:CRP/FNR family cyclic AMP-dependent transcriptional regulator